VNEHPSYLAFFLLCCLAADDDPPIHINLKFPQLSRLCGPFTGFIQLMEIANPVIPQPLSNYALPQHFIAVPRLSSYSFHPSGILQSEMPGGPAEWLATVRNCQYLPETDIKRLCETVKELLMEESNIQPVNTPVTICGDVHGQFYDLLELFRVGGDLPETNYIFMVCL
jgi:hypothetical protein